jgi:hypothetical protein
VRVQNAARQPENLSFLLGLLFLKVAKAQAQAQQSQQ